MEEISLVASDDPNDPLMRYKEQALRFGTHANCEFVVKPTVFLSRFHEELSKSDFEFSF